jgi:hypothetical protein
MEVLYIAYHFSGLIGEMIFVRSTLKLSSHTEQHLKGPYIVSDMPTYK